MKRNPNLGPSTVRAKKRRLFWVRFVIVLFLLLIILISLAIVSGQDEIVIKDIKISGNAAVSNAEVLELVNADLSGRYLGLFSRRNFLIFPRFQIKADLLNNLKTINTVKISWTKWQEITVKITERRPHSVWCGNDYKEKEQTCFLVDKTGYIYNEASTFSNNIFVRGYGPLAATSSIGSFFLETNTYEQIYGLVDLLDRNNLRVLAVSFDNFDYRFYLESGPVIIFNSKVAFDLAFQNLFTAIKAGELDLVAGADKINYIDLRFGDKIVIGKKGK
jgi:hypothetical protein